jgi:hypothetical protein
VKPAVALSTILANEDTCMLRARTTGSPGAKERKLFPYNELRLHMECRSVDTAITPSAAKMTQSISD